MYKIRFEIDKKKWRDFVFSHINGNIFQSPEIYDVYQKTKNYDPMLIAIEDDNNEIQGVLLSLIQKEFHSFWGYFSARAIITGGPLVKNNDSNLLKSLLDNFNNIIKKKVIYSQFRNLWDWKEQKQIFINNGFAYEEHLDIIHDLTKSKNEKLMQMHKGRRKNIRRADRYNLVFKEIENKNELEIAYRLIQNTYKKVRLPLPDKSLFYESYDSLKSKKIIKVFVAQYSKETIGTRIVLCYKDLIYDWYAGSAFKHLDKYPNDYLPWKVMEWGSKNGYKIFDFGGAGKSSVPYGVRDYKLKFGGELVEYGRYEKVHKKYVFQIAKHSFKIWQLLNRFIQIGN